MDNNQNNNKNPKNNKQNWSIIIITTLVTVFLVLGLYSFMQKTTSKEISYSEFLKMLDDKKIEEVVFDTNQLIITPKTEKKNGLPQVKVTYYTGYTGSMEDSKLVDRLEKAKMEQQSYLQMKEGMLAVSHSRMERMWLGKQQHRQTINL